MHAITNPERGKGCGLRPRGGGKGTISTNVLGGKGSNDPLIVIMKVSLEKTGWGGKERRDGHGGWGEMWEGGGEGRRELPVVPQRT